MEKRVLIHLAMCEVERRMNQTRSDIRNHREEDLKKKYLKDLERSYEELKEMFNTNTLKCD